MAALSEGIEKRNKQTWFCLTIISIGPAYAWRRNNVILSMSDTVYGAQEHDGIFAAGNFSV